MIEKSSKRIFTPQEAVLLATLLNQRGEKIVLAGGCFDILHPGHILFLKKAREEGDFLFILLESDEKVKKLKGAGRPINRQEDRAIVLSELRFVDGVIMLPKLPSDNDYDRLIAQLKPAVIAVTDSDPNLLKRERQAEMAGGIIKSVTRRISHSTTKTLAQVSNKNT